MQFANMPSEKIEKSSNLMLKQFKTMDVDIAQNNSQAELFRSAGENTRTEETNRAEDKTLKDVTASEWIAIFILCFVNLINYMDRFTIAGILTDIQAYFNIKDDKGGLLQTVFVITYMIFAPIFGYMGDRYSRKLIMTAGVFLWSLTTLAGSFMTNYWWFLLFRGLVGIGEASYSTIAPTIISDLFKGNMRSIMLALFYFAIPVGSGLGYIVGSETAKLMNSWKWALRVTPVLGIAAVLLIFFILKDPKRGESEGSHLEPTTFKEDIKDIIQNRSFMFSTAGFTCVAFVAGALAWWGPKFIEMGLNLQNGGKKVDSDSVSLTFGAVSMVSGLMGVPMGSYLAQSLRPHYSRIDAHLCGIGLIVSSPLVFCVLISAQYNTTLCYCLVFFAEFFLNLTWSIVADILLYVVLPTRRSTAEGFQLLFSHALGDAGSPYLIGVLSDAFKITLSSSSSNSTTQVKSSYNDFKALQYALFSTCFVEILGGFFFLVTAFYIVEDKRKVEKAIQALLPSMSLERWNMLIRQRVTSAELNSIFSISQIDMTKRLQDRDAT